MMFPDFDCHEHIHLFALSEGNSRVGWGTQRRIREGVKGGRISL